MQDQLIVAGRYRLGTTIAAGGMGTVYRALDIDYQREVALKMLAKHLVDDAAAVTRFKREAALCKRLRHPNIVPGLDSGRDAASGREFLVMELVEGDDAGRLLIRQREFRVSKVIGLIAQVCDAVMHIHGQGIVHGDISPTNILVRRTDQTVKLADFGLARTRWTHSPAGATPVGTPRYFPPELRAGAEPSTRSDLYSLGTTTYHLLAGESSELTRRDVPAALMQAIATATRPEPYERQSSVSMFRAELVAAARTPSVVTGQAQLRPTTAAYRFAS